jgi:hypothetical protein
MPRVFGLGLLMSDSRNSPSQNSSPPASDPVRPGLRVKTIATRLTPDELQEVETAAEREQKSLAEWLREVALRSARERPADPIELLLSELMGIRYAFGATVNGKANLPNSGDYTARLAPNTLRD